MYKLEIETNNTVKRIEDPRRVKVVDLFFTTKVKVMDGNGIWTEIGHFFVSRCMSCSRKDTTCHIKQKTVY